MSNLVEKIDRILAEKQRNPNANLLELEKTYKNAIEKGLIEKAKYDVPDVLQQEAIFTVKKLNSLKSYKTFLL